MAKHSSKKKLSYSDGVKADIDKFIKEKGVANLTPYESQLLKAMVSINSKK